MTLETKLILYNQHGSLLAASSSHCTGMQCSTPKTMTLTHNRKSGDPCVTQTKAKENQTDGDYSRHSLECADVHRLQSDTWTECVPGVSRKFLPDLVTGG